MCIAVRGHNYLGKAFDHSWKRVVYWQGHRGCGNQRQSSGKTLCYRNRHGLHDFALVGLQVLA